MLVLRLLAAFLLLVGATLLAGGAWLIAIGGSPYYLLSGGATAASGILLWRRDRRGSWLYGAMLAVTLGWELWESGLDLWALAPRLIGPGVIGLCLLLPRVQTQLGPHPLSCRWRLLAGTAIAALPLFLVLEAVARWSSAPPSPASTVTLADPSAASVPAGDWPVWGRTAAGTRFSPLTGITPANVGQLEPAWTLRTGMAPAGVTATFEATPLKIGDSLYLCTATNKLLALDPDSGRIKWSYDPHTNMQGLLVATCRGVAHFRDATAAPDSECATRIVTATVDARLIAVDAATGRPCSGFGAGGSVDLKAGMGAMIPGYYLVTSAPTIVRGRIVIGGWVTDNQMIGEPSGVVRAFDAKTGRLAWAWDVGRPGETGEPGTGQRYTPGTPNSWATASADETLGLVYLPMGNATPDYWGGKRTSAMDAVSSSVVALDAETGKTRWVYQTVHHDLWDYDVPAQPTLVDIRSADGTVVPALIQPTKRGQTFVLDRRTGQPIVPVSERPVPGVPSPGDRLSPTQPYSAMPTINGPTLTEAMMWGMTPIDQLWCRIRYRQARYSGDFTPPTTDNYIVYPGSSGGTSWGGIALDLRRGTMLINVNRFAQYGRLISRDEANREGIHIFRGVQPSGPKGEQALGWPQLGTPFALGLKPFMSPLGVPCQQPPYGSIGAMALDTPRIAWSRPFGTARDSGPFGSSTHLPIPLGTPNLGGAAVTASGLAFIGATQERLIRAYDTGDGRILWQARLPSGGNATPMTYRSERTGRQYVVIAAGGNVQLGGPPGDWLMAYALPAGR